MSNDYKNFDCYKTLEIPWNASPQEIRNAYLNKSKEHHPDVGGTNEQQIKINLAYSILSNPLEREQHDRYWNNIYNKKQNTKSTSGYSANNSNNKKTSASSIQQLFTRIVSVFDQALNNLNNEKEGWVKAQVSSYKDRVLQWRQQQEKLFQQKRNIFEEKFRKMRDKQFGLYKYYVAKYNARYQQNSQFKKPLFRITVFLSTVNLFSLILLILTWIFSIELWLRTLIVIVVITSFFITGVFWLWYMINQWLLIDFNLISINDPDCRKKVQKILSKKFSNKRIFVEAQEILAGDSEGVNKIYKILYSKLSSQIINIGGQKIPYSLNDWLHKITDIAHQEGENAFSQEETKIKLNRERYLQYAAEIGNLAERSTTYDTSEEQVARRIAVTFFLMGYLPTFYDSRTRILVFTDGDENIAVRFRHRFGNPTNVSYVKDMAKIMLANHSQKGYLFCTPGLSQNAAKYAQSNGVIWYSLETMNEWIENVLLSGYSGPTGDILKYTDGMINFLRYITLSLKSR